MCDKANHNAHAQEQSGQLIDIPSPSKDTDNKQTHNIDGATWDALGAYGEFTARLYRGGGNLARYVQRLVEEDDNVCIRAVGRGETPPAYLTDSVEEELKTLQMAADLTPEDLTDRKSVV